jgi:hypothetical protein
VDLGAVALEPCERAGEGGWRLDEGEAEQLPELLSGLAVGGRDLESHVMQHQL